jgi:hypothetical protein
MKTTTVITSMILDGKALKAINSNWNKSMQLVVTTDGTFIDHRFGESLGYWKGHSWLNEHGKTVKYRTQNSTGKLPFIEYKGK